jgi:nucleotide-binding universal stress UspA family protein
MDRVLRGSNVDTLVLKRAGNEPVRRILLPTAGGPHAQKAASYAQKLAFFLGGEVTILRILDSQASANEVAAARLELKSLNQTLKGVAADHKVIQSDDVVQSIVDEGHGHDAIMLGAAGNRRKAFFGNIPIQVAARTEKTVLVVKTST